MKNFISSLNLKLSSFTMVSIDLYFAGYGMTALWAPLVFSWQVDL